MPRDKKTAPAKLKTLSNEQLENLPNLNEAEHKFMMCILDGMTASDAYRTAYPHSRAWTDNALWVDACRKRNAPKVRLWLQAIRQQEGYSAIATLEQHTARLEGLAQRAEAAGNYGAAVQAEKFRGASGLYVDRNETTIKADDELTKTLQQLMTVNPELARQLAAESGLSDLLEHELVQGSEPPKVVN